MLTISTISSMLLRIYGIRPNGYPGNETGYLARYLFLKKTGYPAGQMSEATLKKPTTYYSKNYQMIPSDMKKDL